MKRLLHFLTRSSIFAPSLARSRTAIWLLTCPGLQRMQSILRASRPSWAPACVPTSLRLFRLRPSKCVSRGLETLGSSTEVRNRGSFILIDLGCPRVPSVSEKYRLNRPPPPHTRRGMALTERSATEVARLWKNEAPEVKAYYGQLADLEAQEHKQRYPDYRYTPGR